MAAKQTSKQGNKSAKTPQVVARKESAGAPPAIAQPTTFFQGGFWRRHWIPVVLLMAITLNLYQASIKYGYMLDDEMVIWNNAYVQDGFGGIGKIFGADSFMGFFQKKEDLFKLEGGRYRPLSQVTFAAEVGLWGKSKEEVKAEKEVKPKTNTPTQFGRGIPWISHLINIVLYGLTGVLLYCILLGLFPASQTKRWWWTTAFFGALLFVFHPLHIECVANIKGRDEILALLGSLGALYAMMRYFDRPSIVWQVVAAVSFLFGLFSKENTLTFLAVIPLTIWFFGRVSAARAITGAWPLFLSAVIFIIVRYKALGYMLDHGKSVSDLMNDSFLGMSAGERLATIFLTLGWYIKLLFVPYPLTHDYYPYHVPKVDWTNWMALASLAFYVAMGVWAVWQVRKRSVLAYGILFFLLTISIVSNLFVSVGSFMNERFAYMPSVAFCLLAGWLVAEKIPAWIPSRTASYAVGGLLMVSALVGYGWITIDRIPDWETALSLNESAVRVSVNSARAQSYYTTSVYQDLYSTATSKEEKMRWVDTMEIHIEKALKINPKYSAAWVMRANVAFARFNEDKQMNVLFNTLTYCLEKSPYNTMMRNNIDQYMKYLATSGGNPQKINTFAYNIGYEYFLKQKNDSTSAIQFLEYSISTQMADKRVMNALSEAYQIAGKPDKAAEMRQRAIDAL